MHDKDRNDSILELSCAQLCESLDAGQRMTCRFQIHASQYIYGDIYSSDTRVANVQKHFEANTTVDVEINGTYLEPGEEIKGEFCMITNVGEFTLPFDLRINHLPGKLSGRNQKSVSFCKSGTGKLAGSSTAFLFTGFSYDFYQKGCRVSDSLQGAFTVSGK